MAQNKLRRAQRAEVAGVTRSSYLSRYPLYGGARVLPKDENLIHFGSYRAYEIYRDILRDPHSYAVTQKRWLSVVGREWTLTAASDRRIDRKARDMVEAQLKAIGSYDEEIEGGDVIPNLFSGFDQACYNLLRAEHYGFRPAEIIWDSDGKEVFVKQIKDRNNGRFVYVVGNKGYRFRLLTNESTYLGEPLPPKKFIIHTMDPEDDNPYGWGFAARIFYPVQFKRELARFSLIYADKYGTPTGVGKYPNGRKDLKDQLLESISSLAQEGNLAIPEDASFEWLTPSGRGNEVYIELMNYFDREISKVVLGETGSTDQQDGGGSRARDQVGNDVRLELTKASADLLNQTLNNSLIKWIVWYNFGDRAQPPLLSRRFPELEEKEDLNGKASRDRTLSEMMELKPTVKYIEDTYKIEFQEPEPGVSGLEDDIASILAGDRQEKPQQEGAEEFSESLDFQAKKIIDWNGISIGVEYLPGDKRFGKKVIGGYGHVRGTKGADKEALDVYLAPGIIDGTNKNKRIFRVTQLDSNGDFDEYKFMLGYPNKARAKKDYIRAISSDRFGAIKEVTKSEISRFDKKIINDTSADLSEQSSELAIAEVDKMRRKVSRRINAIAKEQIPDREKFNKLNQELVLLYNDLDSDRYESILVDAIAANQLAGQFETTIKE